MGLIDRDELDEAYMAHLRSMSDEDLMVSCALDGDPGMWAEAERRDAEMVRKMQEERR